VCEVVAAEAIHGGVMRKTAPKQGNVTAMDSELATSRHLCFPYFFHAGVPDAASLTSDESVDTVAQRASRIGVPAFRHSGCDLPESRFHASPTRALWLGCARFPPLVFPFFAIFCHQNSTLF
jgi:hypothetical protein